MLVAIPLHHLGGHHWPKVTMAKKVTPKKATDPKPAKAKPAPAPTKSTTMTLKEALRELESLGNAGMRAKNAKSGAWGPGAGDNQFGVKHGDIRVLGLPLAFHGDRPRDLDAAGGLLRRWQGTAGAEAPAGGHGGREADAVEAVVDLPAVRAVDLHRLGEQVTQHRQGEKAVGDGGAVGGLGPCPVRVAVDP